MRILALDVGDKRIGMAVSDEMGWTAQGIETLERTNDEEDLKKIKSVVDYYSPEKIVIGLPKNMNGTLGFQGEKVKEFGELIQSRIFDGEIVYWDERLTTVFAHRIMIDGDMSRKKRKKKVDKIAAVFILQSYLDYLSNQMKESR